MYSNNDHFKCLYKKVWNFIEGTTHLAIIEPFNYVEKIAMLVYKQN